MKRFLTISKLALLSTLALSLVLIAGCSGDSDNGMGPNAAPAVPMDNIKISLTSLYATYDCDTDPVGITSAGDFRYNIAVDTLDTAGKWVATTSFSEAQASVSTGNSKSLTRTKTITLPRTTSQQFRVRLYLREVDGSSNDFSSSQFTVHEYNPSHSQMYAPKGSNFLSYSDSNQRGSVAWTKDVRGRSYVLGVLTKEGCKTTMYYTVETTPAI